MDSAERCFNGRTGGEGGEGFSRVLYLKIGFRV